MTWITNPLTSQMRKLAKLYRIGRGGKEFYWFGPYTDDICVIGDSEL